MIKTSIRATTQTPQEGDTHPLEWAFRRGAELGFDGLELCMRADRRGFVSAWTPELIQGAQDLCRQYGMSIYSLSADWAWSYAFFFPDYAGWGRGAEWLAEDARLAKKLGAHTILMHFGTAKGSWEDCRAALKEVAAAGEEQGVTFGFEANIWANHAGFGGYDQLLRMVDEVGSLHFGVYLHNAYPGAGLPLDREIVQAGERLVQAMHSSSLADGRTEINFGEASAAMKRYFPNGAYTFEVPWDEAEANKRIIDRMITENW